MVHFFGILSPGLGKAVPASEAPHKTGFFGDLAGAEQGAFSLSRAEQDAFYLAGKAAEPEPDAEASAKPHAFVLKHLF